MKKQFFFVVFILIFSSLLCGCREASSVSDTGTMIIYAISDSNVVVIENGVPVLTHAMSKYATGVATKCNDDVMYCYRDNQDLFHVYKTWEYLMVDTPSHAPTYHYDMNGQKPVVHFNGVCDLLSSDLKDLDSVLEIDTTSTFLSMGHYSGAIVKDRKENSDSDVLILGQLLRNNYLHNCYWLNGELFECPMPYHFSNNDMCYSNGHLYYGFFESFNGEKK